MTNIELVILSLIAEQPRHGYDIEQTIEKRGMRAWTEIGFSSIYYLLNKLEMEGLVSSQLQMPEGKGPARKVYQVTQNGRLALSEAVKASLSTPQHRPNAFLMGLANYPVLPKGHVLAALTTYSERLEANLEHIRQREREQQPLPSFVAAMFDYSRTLVEAEIIWTRKFIQDVEAGNV